MISLWLCTVVQIHSNTFREINEAQTQTEYKHSGFSLVDYLLHSTDNIQGQLVSVDVHREMDVIRTRLLVAGCSTDKPRPFMFVDGTSLTGIYTFT